MLALILAWRWTRLSGRDCVDIDAEILVLALMLALIMALMLALILAWRGVALNALSFDAEMDNFRWEKQKGKQPRQNPCIEGILSVVEGVGRWG